MKDHRGETGDEEIGLGASEQRKSMNLLICCPKQ